MLKVFNTLGRKNELFIPKDPNNVTFYQCGPTVYSRQHIGNMRSAILGDLIRRSLIYMGFKVNFVRNITDVGHLSGDDDSGEDKMRKGSQKEGMSPSEIAEKYTKLYHNDIYNKLNVMKPDMETVATSYIEQMAQMVQALIDKGYGYATQYAIYFDVDKFKTYTNLSGQNLEKNIVGAGHGDVEDIKKRKQYDFAIWFFKNGAHKNALQTWKHKFEGIEQNIEEGFPGWHIECSAMINDALGSTIDVHVGGVDHIPVHHTNEIAQSEAYSGKQFVKYWLHHEMMEIDGGKMSKSLGNIYTVDDFEDKNIMPLAFRYFTLQAHYRSKQNFTWEALDSANITLQKIYSFIAKLSTNERSRGKVIDKYNEAFLESLYDDFNTPKAVAVLWEVIKSDESSEDKYKTLIEFDKVLGLSLNDVAPDNQNDIEIDSDLEAILAERKFARENKDWSGADSLRNKIKEKYNLEVIDGEDGQVLRKIN